MNRPLQLTTIVLLALLPSTMALARDCEEEDNWSAVRACTEEQQMAHMEAVYADTLAFVRKDNARAAAWLEKAQVAWLDFATKSCEFTVASRLPDSNDLRFGCWQAFIAAREKVLAAYKRDHGTVPANLMQP